MAYKKYREMKVYEASGYQYKRTPSIVLKGTWLSELGFDIDNTHVLYYLKLNKKANWVKSCFDTCDKDVIYLGKQVLNSKVTEIDLIKELKKYQTKAF